MVNLFTVFACCAFSTQLAYSLIPLAAIINLVGLAVVLVVLGRVVSWLFAWHRDSPKLIRGAHYVLERSGYFTLLLMPFLSLLLQLESVCTTN